MKKFSLVMIILLLASVDVMACSGGSEQKEYEVFLNRSWDVKGLCTYYDVVYPTYNGASPLDRIDLKYEKGLITYIYVRFSENPENKVRSTSVCMNDEIFNNSTLKFQFASKDSPDDGSVSFCKGKMIDLKISDLEIREKK